MQSLIRRLIIWVAVATAGTALAGPKAAGPATSKGPPRAAAAKRTPPAEAKRTLPDVAKVDPRERLKTAARHRKSGDREKALAAIEEGLAVAPKDSGLLYLKCTLLFERNDDAGALAACEGFLEVSPRDAKRVEVEKIVTALKTKMTTFLEVTVANGPASVYLRFISPGVFCRAAPSCKGAVSPGAHKVIVDRPGFQRWTDRVTVVSGQTAKLDVTLTELPSLLSVHVTPPGARVTIDGAPHDAPAEVAPGKHVIIASLEGHAEERREVTARQGRAIELDVALAPIVPLQIEPPGVAVELLLDGKLVAIKDGGIPIPASARELRVRAQGFHSERVQLAAERGPDYTIPVRLRRVELPPPPRGTGPVPFRRKLALAAGGVSLAAVSAGVAFGLQSQQLAEDALALCPSASSPCAAAAQARAVNERGQARALQANVAFGVAGGAAIAAAVLWLTGAPESRVAVTPRLGAVAGLDLTVRY